MKEQAFALLSKVLSFKPIKKAVIAYAKRHPYTHIPVDGSYMERYWIISEESRLSRLLKLSIRLHVIKAPDSDRALHTHPFTFRSLIIEGGYTEQRNTSHLSDTPDVWTFEYYRKAGDTYQLDKNTPHCILSLQDNSPCVTIFIYGPREGDWYFDTDEGLIPHAKYLNSKGEM